MVFSNNLLMGAGGQVSGYEIKQSIRFNDDDAAYLYRDNDAAQTDTKKFTYSVWIKRGAITGGTNCGLLSGGSGTTSGRSDFIFTAGSATGDSSNNDSLKFDIYTGGWTQIRATAKLRDPSSWYHIVLVYDAANGTANDTLIMYLNSSRLTLDSTSGVPNNLSLVNANGQRTRVGADASGTPVEYDGYMAEINMIDGQALTPASFGETNDDGVWIPTKYSGAYGTNGFYLKGQDSSALGDDSSGNGNDFTSSGLAATDQMPDTPTLNHWTLNPLDSGSTLANGNLQNKGGSSTNTHAPAFPKTGKWYVEIDCIDINTGTTGAHFFGICDASVPYSASFSDHAATSAGQQRGGQLQKDNSNTSSGTAVSDGDVIALAFDADNLTLDLYVNNSASGSQITGLTDVQYKLWIQDGSTVTNMQFNFAEASLEYTPPSGFKALSTANLPTPTISDGSKYFQATIYTGDGGGSHEIDQTGNSTFEPSLVWIKSRSATTNNVLQDQVRGNFVIYSDLANPQGATGGGWVNSFDSDGFTVNVNGPINASGETFVGWQWKAAGSGSSNTDGSITSTVSADTTSGFSIVTYEGTKSNATIGHGLGVAPKMIIIKDVDATESWVVGHGSLGWTKNLFLNLTNAEQTSSTIWNDTAPTSSVFSIGTSDGVNKTQTHIAYCFAEVDDYSSIGAYTGNGSTGGPFVYTGFKPAFVILKRTNSAQEWQTYDTERDPFNVANHKLEPNTGNVESILTSDNNLDFLSNGFKLRQANGGMNASGSPYIYIAFAENPFGGEDIAPATAR